MTEPEPRQQPAGWPEPLVEAYETQRLGLVRLAFLITGDRGAAEEVVHDAFVSTLSAWSRVQDPAPYLRATVANGSRAWLRRRGIERRHASPQTERPAASPD